MNLYEFINDPERLNQAKLAYQEQLARDALAAEAARPRTTGQVLGDAGAALLQGAVGLGQTAYGLANMGTGGLLDRATGLSDRFQRTNQIIDSWKSAQMQAQLAQGSRAFDDGFFSGVAEYLSNPALLSDAIIKNLPNLIPAGAGAQFAMRGLAGVGTKLAEQQAAKLAAQGAARAAGLQAAGASNVDIINAAREAGMSDTEAQMAGLVGGAATGFMTPAVSQATGAAGLQAAAAARLMGHKFPAAAGGSLTKAIAGGVAKEGAEEMIQSGAEQMIQNVATGRPVMEGVAESAGVGLATGGIMGGGMGAYTGPRNATPLREAVNQELATNAAEVGTSPVGALSAPPELLRLPAPASQLPAPVEQAPGGPLAVASNVYPAAPAAPIISPIPTLLTGPEAAPAPDAEPSYLPAVAQYRTVVNDPSTLYVSPRGDASSFEQLYQQESGGRVPGLDLFGLPIQEPVAPSVAEEVAPMPSIPDVGPQLELFGGYSPMQDRLDALTGAPRASFTPMSEEEVRAALAARAAETVAGVQSQAAASPTVPTQEWIDRTTGRAPEKASKAAFADAGDRLRDSMFRAEVDPVTGETTYSRYNQALQRSEPVSAEEVKAVEEAGRDWPKAMKTLYGADRAPHKESKLWKQFLDEAAEQDVLPGSENVAEFVGKWLGKLDDGGDYPAWVDKLRAKFDTLTPDDEGQSEGAPSDGEEASRSPASAPSSPITEISGEAADAAFGTSSPFEDVEAADMPSPEEADRFFAGKLTELEAGLPEIAEMQLPPGKAVRLLGGHLDALVSEARGHEYSSDATKAALDSMFNAIKASKVWKGASEREQQKLTDDYNLAFNKISDLSRYSRTEAESGKPLHETVTLEHEAAIKSAVETANAHRTEREGEVSMFNTVADFTAATGVRAPSDAKGVFLADGTVALVAENLKDARDAAATILHERTHEGLRGLLGERTDAVVNRLWAHPNLRGRIKEKMKLGLSRSVAAEEVLVDMAQNKEKLNKDVRAKLRTGVSRLFDKLLGSEGFVVDDGDVDSLLADVVRYRAAGASEPTSRMTQQAATAELDKLLTASPDDRLSEVRFSRALDELKGLAEDGSPQDTNVQRVMSGAAKDVSSMLGGLWKAVKKGDMSKFWRAMYDVAGPAQMHAAFGKDWNDVREDGTKDNAFDRYYEAIDAKQVFSSRVWNGTYKYGEGKEYSVKGIEKAFETLRKNNYARYEKVNALIQYSTFYQLFPGRPVEEQPKSQGVDLVEREKARQQLDRLWKQVGPDGRKLYEDLQAHYKRMWMERHNELKLALAKAKGIDLESADKATYADFLGEFGDTIDASIKSLTNTPYSPLQRYGDYMVAVRDSKGKLVDFTGHDTEAEAKQFAADQRARYGDTYSVSATMQREFNWEIDGFSAALKQRMERAVEDMYHIVDTKSPEFLAMPKDKQAKAIERNKVMMDEKEAVTRALIDTYLHSLPQSSLLQHGNARKYVAGFPLNAERGFSAYSLSSARSIANIKYDLEISKALNDMGAFVRRKGEGNDEGIRLTNIYNAVRAQYDGTKRDERSAIAERLTTLSFLKFMTSPSQAFFNSLQTPTVAAPRMIAEFGAGNTLKALGTAYKLYMSKDGLLGNPQVDPKIQAVLQDLHEGGTDDITLANTMAGLARGQGTQLHGVWRTVTQYASMFLQKSEVMNRQVTAHAYAEVFLKKHPNATHEELLKATKKFIDADSHFNYDRHNDPAIMQGPWRRAVFQFQKYRMNMLAMMARDIRNARGSGPEAQLARRTLAYMLGTQLAFMGAAGTAISPAVFFVLDMFRDDDDLLDSRTEFLRGHSQFMAHGLLSMVPFVGSDPSRIDAGSIFPFLGERAYAPKDAKHREVFNYYLSHNAGAGFGMIGDFYEAAAAAFEGDYGKAVTKAMPKPIADAYKAAADFNGARDARGIKYYQPDVFDTALSALGVRPASRMDVEEKRSAAYQAQKHISEVKRRALGKVALGYATNDEALLAEGKAKFFELVGKHPDVVKPAEYKRTLVNVVKAQRNADNYGVPQARRLSPAVLRAINRDDDDVESDD